MECGLQSEGIFTRVIMNPTLKKLHNYFLCLP
jgi:hypothetical protein